MSPRLTGLLSCLLLLIILILTRDSASLNIAQAKSSKQFFTYRNAVDTYGSDRAVDGDARTYALVDSFDDNMAAWWMVNLYKDYVVRNITVTLPRPNGHHQLSSTLIFNVERSDDTVATCGTYHGNPHGNITSYKLTFTCPPLTIGQYVWISRDGGYLQRYMALAEVAVDGALLSGNHALGKPIRKGNSIDSEVGYRQANDEEYFSRTTCASVEAADGVRPSLRVDLGYNVNITTVHIVFDFARNENEQRRSSYRSSYETPDYSMYTNLNVSTSVGVPMETPNLCTRERGPERYSYHETIVEVTYNCTGLASARYVTIQETSQNAFLLCDVQVNGKYTGESQ